MLPRLVQAEKEEIVRFLLEMVKQCGQFSSRIDEIGKQGCQNHDRSP
ncbi:MAG: hypothetical protein AB7E77_07730 [Desulfobulbus sp.]